MGACDFLRRELERRQARNSRYSLRAFARDLDCDHATLSQWLRGTRPMSTEAEDFIFARLDLSPIERARARELDAGDLQVLEIIRTGASPSSRAVAAATGLSTDIVNVSLARLVRLELLQLDGTDWLVTEDAK
jgi:transcriptional regulator with XRE-family HTH domain